MSPRRLFNAPFEGLNFLLRFAVSRGLLPRKTAPLSVISVGNITMGGTGKTPLVEALARTLVELGAKPAILTRGYKRQGKSTLVLQGDPGPDWIKAGDEPSLLAKRLPHVPVVVDADRLRGARQAFSLGATHALLDDGFQHWPLARDLDLVVVDAKDPLGRKSWRREGPRALAFASRIVCVGKPAEQEAARTTLSRYHPLPPFPVCLQASGFFWQGRLRPLPELSGQKLLAFAGIAHPARFFRTLAETGAQLVVTKPFPDHHPYTRGELELLLEEAKRQGAIPMTTAKDAVRLPQDLMPEVAVLEVSLVPLQEPFTALLSPVLGIR
ncbi:MAG: tetraacyldisaccharide 4'-kinase [Thermoanaerobaculum sp.]